MTKTLSGEKSIETIQPAELSKAIDLVRAAISAEEIRLQDIARGTEQEPVMLEGVTVQAYPVQMMVDPSKVAKVMLDYQYPLYRILGEDAPQGMWDELARMVGLEEVTGIDL